MKIQSEDLNSLIAQEETGLNKLDEFGSVQPQPSQSSSIRKDNIRVSMNLQPTYLDLNASVLNSQVNYQ